MINIDIIPFALLLDRLIIKETVRKASLHLHQIWLNQKCRVK